MGLTSEELKENFTDRKDIVKAILEHERRCFEEIFNEYNFEGWNAIDIMLIVSDEINNRFFLISFIHHYVIESFPRYFRRTYAKMRSDFISHEKIKINIEERHGTRHV